MMDFIIWIVVGGLAGWIASMIMKTNEQMGLLANIVVGVIGAFIGGALMRFLFDANVQDGEFSISSILTAIVGAVVLLFLIKLFTGRKAA